MKSFIEERSAFDLLLDYPIQQNLIYDSHQTEKRFYFSPSDPFLNTKYVIFKVGSVIFYAYDSYAAKAHMSSSFTGIYRPIQTNHDIELKIYKKSWLDYFFRTNKRKTACKYIDDHLTITSQLQDVSNIVTRDSVTLFC